MVSGCATGEEDNSNSTAVGDDRSVDEVDLRSVVLVTGEEAEPGRLLGAFENSGDEAVEVTINDADEDITVRVPAQGSTPLDTVETLLRPAGDDPGPRTALTPTTTGGTVGLLVRVA